MRRSMLALGMLLALVPTPLNASISPSFNSITVEVAPTASEKRAIRQEKREREQRRLNLLQQMTTSCVIQVMRKYPHKREASFTDRITEAFPHCAKYTQSFVREFDRVYGEGQGKEFFLGPYLDDLPRIIQEQGIE